MEIRDFLRRGGSRLAVLILIPVLAMGAAFALGADGTAGSRTVATVVVTPPSGVTGGVVVSQAVESFQSALETDTVRAQAAEASGIPTADIAEGLSSRRLGTSSVVEVIYEGPERAEVPELLESTARSAMSLVFGGELEVARQQRDAAEERFAEAGAALATAQEEADVVDAENSLRIQSGEASQLRVAVAQAESRGDSTAPLLEALEAAEAEEQELAGKVAELAEPQFAFERARLEFAEADQRFNETQGRLEASSSPTAVRVGSASAQSTSASTAQQVIAAGVIGLLLAVALVAIMEVARVRRRNSGATRQSTDWNAELERARDSDETTPAGAGAGTRR